MRQEMFGPAELKKVFPILKNYPEFILIPIIEIIFWRFVKELERQDLIVKGEEVANWRQDVIVARIEEKLVLISKNWCNIDTSRQRFKNWMMIGGFTFQSDDGKAASNLFLMLQEFLKRQELEGMKAETATILKKGFLNHLNAEMHNFYFPRKLLARY